MLDVVSGSAQESLRRNFEMLDVVSGSAYLSITIFFLLIPDSVIS